MTSQTSSIGPDESRQAQSRMDIVNLICSKRDGHHLKDAEIDWIIDAYVRGTVADEQVAALLMAIFWRGLSDAELSRWTAAIIASGDPRRRRARSGFRFLCTGDRRGWGISRNRNRE